MVKRLTVVFVVSMFVMFVFAGGALAAAKADKKAGAYSTRHISQDVRYRGDEEPVFSPMSKYPAYGAKGPVVVCDDVDPEMGAYIELTQIGHTWYDFQKNGAMGRMISVTQGGYRHFSWMFTDGPYGAPNYRYVDANCRTPAGGYTGQVHVYGGAAKNAGYSNQSHLSDGRSMVIYHRTAGQLGDPITNSMVSLEDALCSGMFNSHWDIADSVVGRTENMMWPKMEIKYDDVDLKDYLHIVGTEGETAGGVPVEICYQRCYLSDPNTLVCQAWVSGATNTYTLTKNVNYSDPANLVQYFDSSCSITPVPVVSPVSKRVAIAFLKPACDGSCDYLGDVAWIESQNSGTDWIAGNNIYGETNITNYGCGWPEDTRAYSDLNACYDYNDSLHIVWSTVGFPEPSYLTPGNARLWHWSKEHGVGIITTANWANTDAGGHNANIAKMSISAKDPIYHPGGDPDSMFLFTIWTQFDTTTPLDQSDAEYTNGELYGTGSNDGGMTWGNIWNLTQTRTPGCTPGDCVSEHWSSMAQNMHNGDLHIQYVCDKHPGTALPGQDAGSVWVDNPMYYLNLGQWDVGARCEGTYERVDPGSFHRPGLKITPGGSRTLQLRITNAGNLPLSYTAIPSTEYPAGGNCITAPQAGDLLPTEDVLLTFTVSAATGTACDSTMIQGFITLTYCDEAVPVPVHAIVSDDYYECPVDPETFDTVEVPAARVYVCANSLEWIHDISTWPDTVHEVFFQGGPFVATSMDQGNAKVVGRYYGDNDFRAGVRDKLYTDYCVYDTMSQNADYNCYVLYTKSIFIHYPPTPPYIYHCYWWWWEWSKVIKVCEIDNNIVIIKYIQVKRVDPPYWWPVSDQGPYTGHEDTYIGMMMDIDCPYDTLGSENARSVGGYDLTGEFAFLRGYYNSADPEGHSEYENYYAGMGLADPAGGAVAPYAAHIIKNNFYLYPQSPWGWDDEEFYDLAATPDTSNQDRDSLVDRSIVMTSTQIPAGNDPGADYSFVVIEAASPNGLSGLAALIDTGRAIVAREYAHHGFPLICGDVNGNHVVNLGDAVYLLNYLFKEGSYPFCPTDRADVNSNGVINLGDAVYLLNYLFKSDKAPICPGMF